MKLSIKHIVELIVLVLLLSGTVQAQNEEAVKEDTVFTMEKSPWGAVLRSAVIPGWGQIYNQSYYKAPIIWGISAWLIYGWIQYNNDYNFYADRYLSADLTDPYLRSVYLSQRDFYRDQRDLFSVYLGLVYLLNLIDAYVDAHLFDFTVEEDFLTRYPRIGIKIPF